MPENTFRENAISFLKNFEAIKTLELPIPQKWEIKWEEITTWYDIKKKDNKTNEILLPSFWSEQKFKTAPAIYFFSIDENQSDELYEKFAIYKKNSREKRKDEVLRGSLVNLCHVPSKKNENSSCLYVGSVKKDLYGRLMSHFGFSHSNTGALHLCKIFETYPKPKITFHYYILEEKYRSISEIIERIFQDYYKPILGQRALKGIFNESYSGLSTIDKFIFNDAAINI